MTCATVRSDGPAPAFGPTLPGQVGLPRGSGSMRLPLAPPNLSSRLPLARLPRCRDRDSDRRVTPTRRRPLDRPRSGHPETRGWCWFLDRRGSLSAAASAVSHRNHAAPVLDGGDHVPPSLVEPGDMSPIAQPSSTRADPTIARHHERRSD
jgi:hypothetical protein